MPLPHDDTRRPTPIDNALRSSKEQRSTSPPPPHSLPWPKSR